MSNYSSSYVLISLIPTAPDNLKELLNRLMRLDYKYVLNNLDKFDIPGFEQYRKNGRWMGIFGNQDAFESGKIDVTKRILLDDEREVVAVTVSDQYGVETAYDFLVFMAPYIDQCRFNGIMVTDEYHGEGNSLYTMISLNADGIVERKNINSRAEAYEFLDVFALYFD